MIVVGNRPTQGHFSKISISNFLGVKNMKKAYLEMTEKIYLETFEKCPGSVYFPLLLFPNFFRQTCIVVLQKQINVRINHCPHN